MGERNILLTFKNLDGLCTYEWFESAGELLNFMDEEFQGKVMECIRINSSTDITDIVSDY